MGPAICVAHLLAVDKEQRKCRRQSWSAVFSYLAIQASVSTKGRSNLFFFYIYFLTDENLLASECCMQKRSALEASHWAHFSVFYQVDSILCMRSCSQPQIGYLFVYSVNLAGTNIKPPPLKKKKKNTQQTNNERANKPQYTGLLPTWNIIQGTKQACHKLREFYTI